MRLIDIDEARGWFEKLYCEYCDNHDGDLCGGCELLTGFDVATMMPSPGSLTHSWWEIDDENFTPPKYICNSCRQYRDAPYKYCPNCGAYMTDARKEDGDDYEL